MSRTGFWGLGNRSFGVAIVITLFTFLVFLTIALNKAYAPTIQPVENQPHAKLGLSNTVGEIDGLNSTLKPNLTGLEPSSKQAKPIKDPLAFEPSLNDNDKQDSVQGPLEASPITDDDSIEHYNYCEAETPTSKFYTPVENSTLISVHLMHRHGDRTPTTNLPFGLEKDAWDCSPETQQMFSPSHLKSVQRTTVYTPNGCTASGYCRVDPFFPTFWPGNCSRGQLTPKGIQQLNRLGVNLGDIYIRKMKFLSRDWRSAETDVFVGSTDVWRTQQSVTALIGGFFRGPINLSVYTFPKEMETGVSNYRACPKVTSVENSIKASSIYRQYLATVEPERIKFEAILGSPRFGDELESVFYYIDLFQARSCHKLPAVCQRNNVTDSTPNCISSAMIDQMMVYGNAENRIWYRDHPLVFPGLARLRIGGLLLELKRNLLLAIHNRSGLDVIHTGNSGADADPNFAFPPGFVPEKLKKFMIYSAHDSSLSALLGGLQSEDMRWPPYASSFLLELWHASEPRQGTFEEYRVRMLYNGEPVRTPWCKSGTCPILAFLDYLDVTLEVVGGFENYGRFISDPKLAPPAWRYLKECWV